MNQQLQEQWNKIEFLVGDRTVLAEMRTVPVLPMFSDIVINFLNDLSKVLRKDSRTKELQDVLSYAFWIRKSSIEKEKENHLNWERRMGRGVAYHIAPSNVPVNFAVSMTSALLAGNACIIRVSNKEFTQVDVICDAINQLLEAEYTDMKPYFAIIRYDHDAEVTQGLSDLCDVRIIWGGNETIRLIRQAALPPRAVEMAFADRYSIAVIDADEYLSMDADKVAKDFYTDTYYSDQNACSSPRLVVWLGVQVEEAKERFWKKLHEMALKSYTLHPIQSMNKCDAFCQLAAKAKEISPSMEINKIITDNYLVRVQINELHHELMDYKEAGGYFLEYTASELKEIIPMLQKSCQTVATLGLDKGNIQNIVKINGVRGVDRIVEVGKTMELSFRWDGYDMIENMSRIVAV